MSVIIQPDTFGTILEEINRRLTALELAPSTGLSKIRFARATASVDPTSYGAWEQGAAGATWIDDHGATGAGYPQLTVEINHTALIFLGAGIQNVAHAGTYRSELVDFGVGINGHDPAYYGVPTMYRRWWNPNTVPIEAPVGFFIMRNDFTPNPTKQFAAWANWQNSVPGGTTLPRMIDTYLCIVPID